MNEDTTIDIEDPQSNLVATEEASPESNDATSVGLSLDDLDLESILKWIQRNLYFLVVLLIYFIVSHIEGIS